MKAKIFLIYFLTFQFSIGCDSYDQFEIDLINQNKLFLNKFLVDGNRVNGFKYIDKIKPLPDKTIGYTLFTLFNLLNLSSSYKVFDYAIDKMMIDVEKESLILKQGRVWKWWSVLPPDLGSTSLGTYAFILAKKNIENKNIFLENIDKNGRIYTWLAGANGPGIKNEIDPIDNVLAVEVLKHYRININNIEKYVNGELSSIAMGKSLRSAHYLNSEYLFMHLYFLNKKKKTVYDYRYFSRLQDPDSFFKLAYKASVAISLGMKNEAYNFLIKMKKYQEKNVKWYEEPIFYGPFNCVRCTLFFSELYSRSLNVLVLDRFIEKFNHENC